MDVWSCLLKWYSAAAKKKNRKEIIDEMLNDEQKKFMKQEPNVNAKTNLKLPKKLLKQILISRTTLQNIM